MGGRLDSTDLMRSKNENLDLKEETDLVADSKRLDRILSRIVHKHTEDKVKHLLTDTASGKVTDESEMRFSKLLGPTPEGEGMVLWRSSER